MRDLLGSSTFILKDTKRKWNHWKCALTLQSRARGAAAHSSYDLNENGGKLAQEPAGSSSRAQHATVQMLSLALEQACLPPARR